MKSMQSNSNNNSNGSMIVVGSCSSSQQQTCKRTTYELRLGTTSSTRYLPEDVWIEIFLRLPLMKSIFKFRCVSKLWLSLLSSPLFISKWMRFNYSFTPWTLFYRLHHPVNECVSNIAYPPDLHSQFISDHDGFSFRFLYSKPWENNIYEQEKIYLLASSNGLVLCCSTTKCYHSKYYVCNPLTKKWVSLPHPPSQLRIHALLGFICESSSSLLASTTYKVVRIPEFGDPSMNFDIEIFSSEMGEWKTYKVSCPREVTMKYPFSTNVVSREGVLYWLEGQNRIIVYPLNNNNNNNNNNKNNGHRCSLICLPKESEIDDSKRRCLGQSQGFISYSECWWRQIRIWVLEDDHLNKGWVWHLVHKIEIKDMLPETDLERVFIKRAYHGFCVKPLAFNPVDRNVVFLGFGNVLRTYTFRTFSIYAYNISTRTLKRLSFQINYFSPNIEVFPIAVVPWPTTL